MGDQNTENQTNSASESAPKEKDKGAGLGKLSDAKEIAIGLTVFLPVFFAVFVMLISTTAYVLSGSDSDMEIIARWHDDPVEPQDSASQGPRVIRVIGQVIKDNKPITYNSVLVVALDEDDREYSASIDNPGEQTTFDIELTLRRNSDDHDPSIRRFEIYATASQPRFFGIYEQVLEQTKFIEIDPSDTKSNLIKASGQPFLIVLGLFFAAVVISALPISDRTLRQVRYIFLALVGTAQAVIMIYAVWLSIDNIISDTERTREVVDLGVAYVHYGTYIERMQDQWLLSLTVPDTLTEDIDDAANQDQQRDSINQETNSTLLQDGFGAPLWVIFISVIGSSMFLVRNIVLGFSGKIDVANNENVATIFAHQFYILFAPLSAIFFYQLVAVGGGASKSVTVAIVALASAVLLSWLLDYAVRTLQSSAPPEREGD